MPNYSPLEESDKQHLSALISWLIDEVLRSGGDGDGIWYSKFYSVDSIKQLIKDKSLLPKGWKIFGETFCSFSIGYEQEWLKITNNKEDFDGRPSWQQVVVVN